MAKIRLGIYGGTFSPPHLGHVCAAHSFARGAALDKLIIMPDFTPPHKSNFGNVAPEDRLEMCRIAFSDVPCAEVSDFEILRGGKSYTYLTLQAFANDDVELFFLCGTDMLLTLDAWKCPEIIFDLATICYVRRESDASNDALIREKIAEFEKRFGARIIALEHEVFEASSSDLRLDIEEGGLDLEKLPSGVKRYILGRGLYR